MSVTLPFLPLLLIPASVGLVLWLVVVQRRRMIANLQKLAPQLGLDFLPGGSWFGQPSLVGTRRGKTVQIFNYTTGSGKSRTTWSAVKAALATPSPLTFTLKKQGLGTKISELFGAKEITVGDTAFDQAWFVQTNQPEFLRAALIPELRERLLAAQRQQRSGAFELKNGAVQYAEIGSFADAKRTERFAALADLVCDLADVAEVAAQSRRGG
jgi:hypothetical protein